MWRCNKYLTYSKLIFTILERRDRIEDIIRQKPVTLREVAELFHSSERYIIPYNQTHCKQYAIVMYNTEERPGWETESNQVVSSVVEAGFHTFEFKWKHASCIIPTLDNHLKRISGTCCLLLVSIMSHGSYGRIAGIQNSSVSVNEVLGALERGLPTCNPLVRHSWKITVGCGGCTASTTLS